MMIVMVVSFCSKSTVRVHLVHAMLAERALVAADIWTKPINLSQKPACSLLTNYIHHRHLLLLLSPIADTQYTVPRRVEG